MRTNEIGLNRIASLLTVAILAAAGCARNPAPALPGPHEGEEVATPADTARRWLLRPVPVSRAYARALEGGTRDASGRPGARYWQQYVRYAIQAELDPATAEISGRQRIVYLNRSPDALASVVLNLYGNVYTETARRNRVAPNTGGVRLGRVAAQGTVLSERPAGEIGVVNQARSAPVGYAVDGTLARLVLPRPIAPGDSAVLDIEWRHRVPPSQPAFRTAWEDALGGRAFQVAQWYPQVAVYDDVNGWDATPYLGDGEFYLEYADFDVSLTLPAGWLVGATGVLANPTDVLTRRTLDRLERAARSDTAVPIVSATEVGPAGGATLAGQGGRLTWRFTADSVRDFAFAASDRYAWDAAGVAVAGAPGGRVVVHALYRPGAPNWERAARYAQHAIGFFSREIVPYPYPQVTVAEGRIGGMEYPMLVFIGKPPAEEQLQGVIAHEVGHEWFPMLVGQNEAAFAWMDEGVTTYYEALAADDLRPGEDGFQDALRLYLAVAGTDQEVPLTRHTDLVTPYGARTVAAYGKPAVVLRALRAVVGDSVFRAAMLDYATAWRYRHPQPWDFWGTFERVSGRDLDWFIHPWWFETGTLDHAIASVRPAEGGVEVTLRDLGGVPAPTRVVATTADGLSSELEVPVAAWLTPPVRTLTFTLPTGGDVVRVEIDPGQAFPDVDRANNVWTPAAP